MGVGAGPGVGEGHGGGIGGGVFHVGGGVSAPQRPLPSFDPEYSEEARKAKYSGNFGCFFDRWSPMGFRGISQFLAALAWVWTKRPLKR